MRDRIGSLALYLLLTFTSATQAELHFRGVNLSGAEFGAKHKIPGTFGTDYTYPSSREVDYFLERGMNTFRIPFRWERMQPELEQPLDATELERLDKLVRYITEKGAYALLDLHNYSRYRGQLVGSQISREAFADIWRRLAEHYRDNPRVLFGLMNEPHTMPTDQWVANANAALAAIRDAGADNLALVPGNGWTNANGWFADRNGGSNAEVMRTVVDPGDNYLIEAHQYFDRDASGTDAHCIPVDQAQLRLKNFTQWLRDSENRGFLGEFGVGRDEACLQVLAAVLSLLEENSDVWAGWTYWSAGPWWGNYHSTLTPADDDQERPQMTPLRQYLPPQ